MIFDFPKPIPMYNIATDKKKNQGTRNARKRKTYVPRREFEMEPSFNVSPPTAHPIDRPDTRADPTQSVSKYRSEKKEGRRRRCYF